MRSNEQNSGLQYIILELERKFPYFKKMDVYAAVSQAYKKTHILFKKITDREMDEIREIATRDLSIS